MPANITFIYASPSPVTCVIYNVTIRYPTSESLFFFSLFWFLVRPVVVFLSPAPYWLVCVCVYLVSGCEACVHGLTCLNRIMFRLSSTVASVLSMLLLPAVGVHRCVSLLYNTNFVHRHPHTLVESTKYPYMLSCCLAADRERRQR